MSLPFARLEQDLKAKLSQRVTVRQSPEQCLFKSFKFFDVSDSGLLNLSQCSRALEKIGLSCSAAELEQWFRHYDDDNDGRVNYKALCASLFSPITGQMKSELTPSSRKGGLSVIELVKRTLADQGEEATVALDLHLYVNSMAGRLTKGSFAAALREVCPSVDQRNSDLLFELASSQQRSPSYAEISEFLWGTPNRNRTELIQLAFSRLDDDGDGFISMRSIRRNYAAKHHPSVTTGSRSVDDAFRAFYSSFESHHRKKGLPSEQVSSQEWCDYYRLISAITASDTLFETMLKGVWTLNEPATPSSVEVEVDLYGDLPGKLGAKRGRIENTLDLHQSSHLKTGARHRDSTSPSRQVDTVLGSFRQKLAKRGVGGILGLSKQLSLLDSHGSGLISLRDLMKVLRNYQIDFNDSEIISVFQHFDKSRTGSIPYKRLLNAIIGQVANIRQQAIEEAWESVSQGQSSIDLRRLVAAYDTRKHPDVKLRGKTEGEVYNDFTDSLTAYKRLEGASQGDLVSKADFLGFYELMSSCYEDNHKFERMVRNCWHLTEGDTLKPKLKDRWGADHRFIFGGSTASTAPFGVSNDPTDWSTSLRPRTAHKFEEDRRNPAGSPTKHRPTTSFGVEDALAELRASVKVRGYRGLLNLAVHFQKRDSNVSGSLPADSLKAVLRELRIPVSEAAVTKLSSCRYFSGDQLQYQALLAELKGQLNSYRKTAIVQTFNKLTRHNDSIPLHELKQKFIAKNHPSVLKGRQNEDTVLNEFLSSVDIHQALLPKSTRPLVTVGDFQDFYWYVSACIEDDREFEQLLRSSWLIGWNSTF